VLRLDGSESGEGGEDGQALGIAGVDPGEERLAETVHRLLPEPPAQEAGDRLVAVLLPPGTDEVEAHPQLARPGEEPASSERQDPRRHRQHHALG
jgi:hypothetical protein